MRLFSTKRGNFQELVLGPLFPLIIVFAVFLILLSFTNAVAQSSYFEREFLTKDIGLVIESLQASPYDVQLNYPDENSKHAKELKITINKNYVQANPYNVEPLLSPSKTSKFLLFQSNMPVADFVAAPKVEKDQNGVDMPYSYRLSFLKNINGISSSSNQNNIPVQNDESYFKSIINTQVSEWAETPHVYVDMFYTPSDKDFKSAIDGKIMLRDICRTLDLTVSKGIYSLNDCTYPQASNDRKKQAETSDLIVILYVNEQKQTKETIDVYYSDKNDVSGKKSQKLAGLSLINLKPTYSDTEMKRMYASLILSVEQISESKPVIVVEIGNVEKLNRQDIEKIGNSLISAIRSYYS